jgi:hypothetical protein
LLLTVNAEQIQLTRMRFSRELDAVPETTNLGAPDTSRRIIQHCSKPVIFSYLRCR